MFASRQGPPAGAWLRFGLETAQRWRERLGLARDAAWDRVLAHLSPLPSRGGLYVNAESAPDTFTVAAERRDHPTLLAPCGMLPCTGVDGEMMRRTLVEVMRSWNFHETSGWDYPLVAMTAARVGEPGIAIDALLMDTQKNTCLPNGHNYQDPRLTLYLPGNGGLLTAVAMMAAGWDGAPDTGIPERRTLEGEVGRTEADAVAPAGPVRVNVETVNQRAACTS